MLSKEQSATIVSGIQEAVRLAIGFGSSPQHSFDEFVIGALLDVTVKEVINTILEQTEGYKEFAEGIDGVRVGMMVRVKKHPHRILVTYLHSGYRDEQFQGLSMSDFKTTIYFSKDDIVNE